MDTKKYGPHSIRSASSTKVIESGHIIEEVEEHANWSRNTQTFQKFYYKPTTKTSLGSQITYSIFSAENFTTLEAEVEATEIVLGTTNNIVFILGFRIFSFFSDKFQFEFRHTFLEKISCAVEKKFCTLDRKKTVR